MSIFYFIILFESPPEKVLQNAGRVSHQEAIEKATTEFKKYQVKTLSAVEEDYLRTLKSLEKKLTN